MIERTSDSQDIDFEIEATKRRRFCSAGLAGSAADRMAAITGRSWKHVFCPTRPGEVTFRIQEVPNAKL